MTTNAGTKIDKIRQFNEENDRKAKEKEDQKLKDAGAKDDSKLTNDEKIAAKAKEHQKTEQEIADEQKRLKEEEEARRVDALRQVTDATATLVDRVNQRVNPVTNWIASQPTPGGIAAIVVFIIIMALAVIPVNDKGQTRLYLLWQTLLNRTHMLYRETTPIGNVTTATSNGASGDFGTTTATHGGPDITGIDLSKLDLFGFGR